MSAPGARYSIIMLGILEPFGEPGMLITPIRFSNDRHEKVILSIIAVILKYITIAP